MRFGASIWPWRWNTPYGEAIQRLSRAGFRATELIAWDPENLASYYTDTEVKHLRSILDTEGMALSQFVVNNSTAADADPSKRRAAVEMFKRGVDTGAALGAPIINTVTHVPFGLDLPHLVERPLTQVFTMEVPPGLDWQRNWEDYVVTIKECADYAAAAGLKYSVEPHPFRYGANTEALLRLIEAVGSPALGVNFDPSHLFPVGEIPHLAVHRLGAHVLHCHFSDNDGTTNVHWRPGKGKIDWSALLRSLKDTGFDGVISLEFEDIPGVSRGEIRGAKLPANWFQRDDATEGFEAEYKLALGFLIELADEVGLRVER